MCIAMRELCTTYYHVSFSCQINESQTIIVSHMAETVQTDCVLEETFFPNFCVHVSQKNFDVVFGTTTNRLRLTSCRSNP